MTRLYKKSNVLTLDLEDTIADQNTRLTAAEENIQGSSLCLKPIPQNYKKITSYVFCNKYCKF